MICKVRSMSLISLLVFCLLGSVSMVLPAQESEREQPPEAAFAVVNEVWRTPAKSQDRTGTCWSFSTISFIESELHRLGAGDYELSEMFPVYHAYVEKARRYLRLHGHNNLGQGGLSHDVTWLVGRYGLLRDDDYSGLQPGEERHNHRELARELRDYIESILASEQGLPPGWEDGVRAILDTHLGPLPETVEVNGRQVTPQQFASEIPGFDPANYVEITSYSYMPFDRQGELLIPDNWLHNSCYYNVGLDDFMGILDYALENGYSVVVDADVSETTFYSRQGYAVVEQDGGGTVVSQAERDAMFDDLSTTDDHLMHIVGVATGEEGARYYLTKNSHGLDRGPYEGHIYLSANYVRAKVLAIMIHVDGIPPGMRERLGIE